MVHARVDRRRAPPGRPLFLLLGRDHVVVGVALDHAVVGVALDHAVVGVALDDVVVGVALDDRVRQRAQALQHLARLRPPLAQIAGDAESVEGTTPLDVGQDGLQSGQVAVDVRKDGQPHESSLFHRG